MAKVLWADRVKQTAGSAPSGAATTFDINTSAASGGFIKFESIPGIANGDLVFYSAHAATLFECGYGAIDTTGHTLARTVVTSNSSGTTSKIDFSAGSAPELVLDVTAKVVAQVFLPNIAGSDAAKTMDIGVNNEAPVGSFTADRIYTFPSGPNDGDQFEVTAVTGSATYECILQTNSDKGAVLQGTAIAVSTEVTRLLMAGERMRWKFNGTADKWLLALEGRVPIVIEAIGTNASMTQNVAFYPAWGTRTVDNSSAYDSAPTNKQFNIRRAGNFRVSSFLSSQVVADATAIACAITVDPNGTPVDKISYKNQASFGDRNGGSPCGNLNLAADTKITSKWVNSATAGTTALIGFHLTEVL